MQSNTIPSSFPQRTTFFIGNSLMNYSSGNVAYGGALPNAAYVTIISTRKTAMQNYSVGGKQTAQMITEFPTVLQPFLKPRDIVFFWEIANDLGVVNAAQAYTNCQTYCGLVRAMGAKVVIATSIPSGGPNEAAKATVDGNIRSNWASFADGFCDFRAVTHFQVAADSTDLTYYNVDGTHLTTLGYNTLAAVVAPLLTPFLT